VTSPTETPNESSPTETPPEAGPSIEGLRPARSLLLVNTGDGKGKSTAAFGTLIRAVARGWPTAVVQFLKSGDWHVGEQDVAEQLGVAWHAIGEGFTWDSDDLSEDQAVAQEAWRVARELIEGGEHRLVVLDEITYPITWGWIPLAEVVAVLGGRPDRTSVIVTGRDCPPEIIEVADTVTEMRKVKHAFDAGIVAKKGIDY